jgi:anthranilate synthase/aminodeoxychorismate synthase-like glutamine amidotransferase
MILIIDNYDSFVYNLAQYVGELGGDPAVYRNDAISIGDIDALKPSHIIISPGPCTPNEAGISNDVILNFSGKIPILGVCLGHQCIGQAFGMDVVHARVPTHGKSSPVCHDGRTIFQNLPNPFQGGRYHSLIVDIKKCPPEIEVSATIEDGTIMGIRHKQYRVEGVQFHPESIMTDAGHELIQNFLRYNEAIYPRK